MKKRLISLLLCAAMLCMGLPALAEGEQYGYVNIDTSLYMGASESAVVQMKVSLGSQVRIEEEAEEDGTLWYRVTLIASQASGWLKAEDVDLVIARRLGQEAPSAEPEAVPAEEPAENAEPEAPKGPVKVENEKDFPVLTASGALDPDKLQGAPKTSDYKELKIGDSGKRVDALRERLMTLGYMGRSYDPKLNNNDIIAVKRFQRVNGLTEDGVISKKLQVKLFSTKALNNNGEIHNPDGIILTNAQAIINNAGGSIRFGVKNNISEKIDAFNFSFRFWDTYGERYLLKGESDNATLSDELTALDFKEERTTLNPGAAVSYSMNLGSLAIPKGQIAITAYHTESGKTVRIDDDQLHWFSFEKNQKPHYEDRLVTPLTSKEVSLAKAWDLGVTGDYIEPGIAEAYGLREGMLVSKVKAGSPAEAAGLKVGDLLLAVGDIRIFGASSLTRAESAIKAGKSAVMLFVHNGTLYQSEVVREKKSK